MKISSKLYDIFKWVALICLPAIICFLSSIGEIWGIGMMPKIVATVSALATFLGALLQISSINYHKDKEENGNGKEV